MKGVPGRAGTGVILPELREGPLGMEASQMLGLAQIQGRGYGAVCAGPGGSGETLGQSLLECSRAKGNSRQAYWALDVEKLGNKCWENKSCGSAGPTKM